ncbi:MAG TPA: hypothetical protein VFA26_24230 [Gemmataceae bacterium]|nr:hypothetical protein [Gemmataceae bacterium]
MKALFRIAVLSALMLAAGGLALAQRGRPGGGLLGRPPGGGLGGGRPGEIGIRPGGPGFRPGPRPANPAELMGGIRNTSRNDPAGALRQIGSPEARNVLTPQQRAVLARQTVDLLAARVQGVRDPWDALSQVRQARRGVANIDPQARQTLEALDRQAEQRVLAQSLAEVAGLTDKPTLAPAADQAKDWLARFQGPERVEGGQLRQIRAPEDVRTALTQVVEAGARLAAVEQAESAFKVAERHRPAQTAEAMRRLEGRSLPEPLREVVRGLRALAELEGAAAVKWERPPDVARLRQNVVEFERVATAQGEPTLARALQQDLAMKALLDGHPAEARALLPTDGPPDHAARLVRDLKALLLGEGKVESQPARKAVDSLPDRGGGRRDPPPALRPLFPEGSRESWRPPVAERAGADLPPLEKAAALEKPLIEKARAALKTEQAAAEQLADKARQRTIDLHRIYAQRQERERQQLQMIEAELKRKLTPGEQAQVLVLREQGKDGAAIVAHFAGQKGGDEEQFIEEVEALLGRPLTPAERTQAVQLRRAGRTAAEVADTLRAAGR